MRWTTRLNWIILFTFILISLNCTSEPTKKFYPMNQKPLLPTKLVKLPLGTIKPSGWLRDQLLAQRHGLTGHLDEFWPDLINSAWKGGDGEAWERGPYYLDGLVPLAYLLEDEALIQKTKPWIEWILSNGQPNGWFGPPQNQDRWPLAVALKVLHQYFEATNDPRAIELIQKYFQYLHENPPDWPDDSWRGVRALEHAVTGYWLFRRTDDIQILKTIESIVKNSFNWADYFIEFPWDTEALHNRKIPLNWKSDGLTAHVVNVAMAVKYPGLWYQQSIDEHFKTAVYRGLHHLDAHHGQVGGRFSGDEHLSGKRPTQGTELCAIVELMYSLENLIEIFADAQLADRLEMLAYNCLPGTMTPDGWAHQYDQQANQVLVSVAERAWSTNGNTSNIYGLMPNYPCCLANLHQGWPKFVAHLFMATPDQGLAAVAYGPCVVTATVGDNVQLKLAVETEYPFDSAIQFKLELSEPARFPLYFRIPNWATNAKLVAQNETVPTQPGTFVKLVRRWQPGDMIQLDLPLHIRTERRFNQAVSLIRGPLYFSLRIGKTYRKITLKEERFYSIDYLGSVDWEITPTTPWNYGLRLDPENPTPDIKVERYPIQTFPFADIQEMVFHANEKRHQPWPANAPVVLTVAGKKIPGWQLHQNSSADPPMSPVQSNEATEELQLVPYGCSRLRITEFPLVE